ncbi:glutamine amidotransferase [Mycobacterium asiaticum]|uniref:Glutamine amidotransferase n=2 Tax=Mycobacterium asiaticum TaxID=1790 RepID=A0A1A3BSS5_MYCAS|nr:glutamine amidotransferase [Mycobacterium asiaticum]
MIPFPGLTMLDLIGPYETLREHTDVHLLGSTTDEFFSDSGAPFRATELLCDAADFYDVVFVPGGNGTADAMRDPQIIDFLVTRGPRARYVTSVCTGSLVLGAAGLLNGYRATTHWSMLDALPFFGAIPAEERVVIDRNRITGGGVTAGIDFGLLLLAELFDEETARYAQLLLEYDPAPPFDGGSPRSATQDTVQYIKEYVAGLMASCKELAAQHKS